MDLEEETIDDLLKDLKESSNQNKLMKNIRLNKRNALKSNNHSNNFGEIFSESLIRQGNSINSQSLKSNERTKSENVVFPKFGNKNTQQKLKDNLFKDYSFIVIPDKNELSGKRIKILTEQIGKRQGSFFTFTGLCDNLEQFLLENVLRTKIIISSKSNLYENCEKCFKICQCDLRTCDFPILDFEWLCECFRCNEIVDPNIYRLFKQYTSTKTLAFIANPCQDEAVLRENISPENLNIEEKEKNKDNAFNINENSCVNIENNEKNVETYPLAMAAIPEENKQQNELDSKSAHSSTSIKSIGSEALEERNLQKSLAEYNQKKDFFNICSRHLIDYSYDSDEDEASHSIELKKEEPFVINSEDEKYENDSDIEYIGSNKIEKKENGSLFEGINLGENAGLKLEFKEFKYDNPGQIKRERFWDNKKDNFFCATGIAKDNNNNFITDELDKLLKIYTNEKDKGRMIAYRKAISMIKAQKKTIDSIKDVENLPAIGSKIKAKILEILETGKLRKATFLQNDVKNKTIDLLSGVWGIGPTTAERFYFKGIKTLEDLKANEHLLNSNQKIGLKYYEELKQRIPRDEIAQVCKIVAEKIEDLSDVKNIYEMIPCGSYRRGKETCGDIDILLTRKDGNSFSGFLSKLIQSLEGILLTDHLALPKPGSHQSETYMGIYQLEQGKCHRRIDMKIYPREHFGYAVLYFTGSDYFNRSMRLFARKKGYTLSDHGLHPAFRIKNQKVWEGENIPCYTEEDVFKVLGLEYRKPEERSV